MKRPAAVTVLALAFVLAGCGAPEPAPTVSEAATVVETPAPTPTSSPTPTPTVAGAPAECVAYTPEPITQVSGGDEIVTAASQATLPPSVILNPGVQTIVSTEEPGMIDVVARICSAPMDRAALIDSASEIAMAIRANPAGDRVSVLVVTAWMPGENGYLDQGESVRTDFQLFTWDPDAAAPMSSNWS